MERAATLEVLFAVFGPLHAVRALSEISANGVSFWPALTAVLGLLLPFAVGWGAVRGELSDGYERVADSDAWFWFTVVFFVLFAATTVYDSLEYVRALS